MYSGVKRCISEFGGVYRRERRRWREVHEKGEAIKKNYEKSMGIVYRRTYFMRR